MVAPPPHQKGAGLITKERDQVAWIDRPSEETLPIRAELQMLGAEDDKLEQDTSALIADIRHSAQDPLARVQFADLLQANPAYSRRAFICVRAPENTQFTVPCDEDGKPTRFGGGGGARSKANLPSPIELNHLSQHLPPPTPPATKSTSRWRSSKRRVRTARSRSR